MGILTWVTNGMLFSFGAWAAFIIVMGLAALIIYIIGGVLNAIAER